MVYELSNGSLYPLQGGANEKVCAAMIHYILCISVMGMSQSSNSSDSCQYVDGCTFDGTKSEHQHSTCSDESENNDHSDIEHIDLSGSNSESSSPRNDVQRQTELEFLIPDYKNQPDLDDIFGLKWGRDHYIRYFPSLKRCLYT